VRIRRPTTVVAVLLAVAVSACGQQGPSPARDPAPQAGTRAVASGSSGLDATARAWVELTIATDDQAVRLLDLGAARASSPGLRDFAGALASARRAELTQLHGLLGATPYVNNHSGHDMPGMPTEAELIALSASTDFDADFTRLARNHLTESQTVARSGETAITDTHTRAVASAMVRDRTEALRSLDALG
jgi:uncharacterized protein (DUF305 family)